MNHPERLAFTESIFEQCLDDNGIPNECGLAVYYVYRCEIYDRSFGRGELEHVARQSMATHAAGIRRIVSYLASKLHRVDWKIHDIIRMLNSNNGREINLDELRPLFDKVNAWILEWSQ